MGPFVIVLFGAAGELARTRVLPALDRLGARHEIRLLAADLHPFDRDAYLAHVGLPMADVELTYTGVGDDHGYATLAQRFWAAAAIDDPSVFVHLSVPPDAAIPVLRGLERARMLPHPGVRLIHDKPFGSDLASATDEATIVERLIGTDRLILVDHYLAKAAVENLLALRFSNPLLDGAFDRHHVASIEISAWESEEVGRRERFYERTGVVRDMAQNHLMQVLALLTMEAPPTLGAADLARSRLTLLRSIRQATPDRTTLGQYDGYGGTLGAAASPATPTYVRTSLRIDNARWAGVPVELEAGRAMPRDQLGIKVRFGPVAHCLFHPEAEECPGHWNELRLELQPENRVMVSLEVLDGASTPTPIGIERARKPQDATAPEYDRLIEDALHGDMTRFPTLPEVREAWRIWNPVVAADVRPASYPAGRPGPG